MAAERNEVIAHSARTLINGVSGETFPGWGVARSRAIGRLHIMWTDHPDKSATLDIWFAGKKVASFFFEPLQDVPKVRSLNVATVEHWMPALIAEAASAMGLRIPATPRGANHG